MSAVSHATKRFTAMIIFLVILAVLLSASKSVQAKSEANGPPAPSTMELLQAETLDTVSLDQAVYFITSDTANMIVEPGTYRVVAGGQGQLKLIAVKGNKTVIVSALNTTHHEEVPTPIALHLRDDEKFPHVLLLLPDGNALEAVGSYDVVRSRKLHTFSLSQTQIRDAVEGKLHQGRH